MANLSNINNKFLVTTGGNVLIGQTSAVGSSIFQVTGNSTFAGNVGIGAAASDGNLHVRKTGVNTGITNVLMNANFADGSNGTGLSIGYRTDETTAVLAARTATGNIAFYSYDGGWSESMRITNTGNVGIGTASPSGLLHVKGDTNSNGAEIYLQVNNNNTTDNLGAIHFGNNIDSTLSEILSQTSGANNSSSLIFSTSSTGTKAERMRIDSSGNLLLGNGVGNPYLAFLSAGGNGGNERARMFGYADGGTYGGGLKLQTRDNSNIFNDALVIDRSGNAVIKGKIESVKELVNINSANGIRSAGLESDSTGNIWLGTGTTAATINFVTGNSTNGNPSVNGVKRLTTNREGTDVYASYAGNTFPFRVGYLNGSTYTPTFVVDDNSNVGIGTDSPNVLLQLRSNVNTIPANTDFAMRSGKSFRFLGDGDGNGDYGSYIEAPTKGIITIGTRWVGGDEGGLTVNRGNVGIGTTVATGGFNVNNTTAGSYYNMSNSDSGNYKYTNAGGRLLTSNATGWFADGRDPILTLSTSGNSNNSAIGNSIGLNLYTNSATSGVWSPLITFSALSDSGNYANAYAAIAGRKVGLGPDSNWNTGDLCFWTSGPIASNPASYMQQTPSMIIQTGGNVGIGTDSPDALLELSKDASGTQGATLRLTNSVGGSGAGVAIEFNGPGTQPIHAKIITEDAGAFDSNLIFQTKATGTGGALADRLTIDNAGDVGIGTVTPRAKLEVVGDITIQNGVYTYKAGSNTAGSIAVNVDIPVGNEGGAGNVFKIEAGFAHYYAMNYNSVAEWWCTSRGTSVVNTYILNAGTTLAGDWSASKPNTTTLRVTKSAGTYGGGGKWWVKVTYIPF